MKDDKKHKLIVILGPTATGKTRLAALLAGRINGEIISADSRQVYRGMDLGTGKDYEDYKVGEKIIPYHLVDIVDPGYEYNVFEYQRDFIRAFEDIVSRGRQPILCGGTGMYIEAVLDRYKLVRVPENKELRTKLEGKPHDRLIDELLVMKSLHNVTDTEATDRLIRALEIGYYYKEHPEEETPFPEFESIVFGITFDRKIIRTRITERLKKRLDQGMIDEVRSLLEQGISPEKLKFYGLEYRYLTQYILGEISYEEMFRLLNTAIHQFAKRQMTWFRRMEKKGTEITWLDGDNSEKEQIIEDRRSTIK
ncbi:MAG: tRNA (adenosine(37)-N6)-dimethylallyltransferase MiaA [Bacteroidetes bacterium]|nr:tRNA (adenosine(37)-N6)-dimethylallyltransferase MiaA [Bacteroidota bacterium]